MARTRPPPCPTDPRGHACASEFTHATTHAPPQVPRDFTEDALWPIFEEFGVIERITIIRDRENGSHRGCAVRLREGPPHHATAALATG